MTSAVPAAPPAESGGKDSIPAPYAGFLDALLAALGLLAFVGTVAVTSSSAPSSLAFATMSGVALLSLTLVGIVVLTRASARFPTSPHQEGAIRPGHAKLQKMAPNPLISQRR